jgi:alpha-L-fucosidase
VGKLLDSDFDDLSAPLSAMRLERFDADQWCAVAQSLGARYVLLVAKHVGGFCWWPTATTDYSVRSIPWRGGKGDLVGEVAVACRRRGLKLAIYVSPRDEHFKAGTGGKSLDPARQSAYEEVFRTQLTELLSNYGELCELWFDGSLVFDVQDLIGRLQPHVVQFQGCGAGVRWCGNEDGVAPVNGGFNAVSSADACSGVATSGASNADGDVWLPIEADFSIRRPHWFWRPNNLHTLMSPGEIVGKWYTSVGRGAQMIFGVCPDTSGAIPAEDAMAVAAAGHELRRRFAAPIADGAACEVSVGARCDHVLVEADLSAGEAVRAWTLEALVEGVWRELAAGIALGRKRAITFNPLVCERVRLRVTAAKGEPRITRLAIFDARVGRVPMPEESARSHWFCLTHHSPAEIQRDGGRLVVELAPHCTVVGQWRVTVQPHIAIAAATLSIDGQPVDGFLILGQGGRHVAMINLTGLPRSSLRLDMQLDPHAITDTREQFIEVHLGRWA